MAVTSGLSVSPDHPEDGHGARQRRGQPGPCPGRWCWGCCSSSVSPTVPGCRCWPIRTVTGTSPSATGCWRNGTVPTVDPFSFTFAGQPWIAKEWLSQLLMAVAFKLGGWGGVTALAAGALGVSFALMLRLLLRDLRPLPAAVFVLAAIAMTLPHFLARPHVLAFPFMLIWMAGLVRAVEERRAPAPLLLLAMLLWANLHGGFTLGLLLGGAFALEALLGARDAGSARRCSSAGRSSASPRCSWPASRPTDPNRSWVTLRIFGLGDTLGLHLGMEVARLPEGSRCRSWCC